MKKIAFYLSLAVCIGTLLVACTKPDSGTDNTPVTPPMTQDKEEEKPEPQPQPEPVLEALSTSYGNKAVYGQKLVLTGSNFNAQKNANVVLFDDIACTDILEASETKLVAKIPLFTGKENVKVRVSTVAGTSNALTLYVDIRRCDSALVFQGAKMEELRPGVTWTSTITTWKGEPRSINIVSIPPSEFKNLHFTFPAGMKKTSDQCVSAGALLGVNGQYFDNKTGGTGLAHDYLKIDGTVMRIGRDKAGYNYASGVFVFSDDYAAIKAVNYNEGARELADPNVMACGPLLIDNGKYTSLPYDSHNNTTHPRTAVAVTYDNHVLLVTIDGRFPGQAVGMPTPLMQEFFTLLGAKSALNLDGGGSTTMYIMGRGMVNHGSDGNNWNNPTERAVNSIIYLK